MSDKKDSKFRPGQSGNPRGRKPGSGHIGKLREELAGAMPDVVDVLIKKAKEGDIGALRIVMERLIPPLRAIEPGTPFDLPAGSLAEQGKAVLAAVSSGEIAIGQGAQLLAGLSSMAKIIETDDLAKRIEALEKASEAKKG